MPSSLILQILKNPPPWVFGLFFVLLWFGWLQSRTRSMHIGRLALLPLVMLGLSFSGVASAFGAGQAVLAAWTAGVALAVAASHLLGRPGAFAYSAAARQITVPGSWLPLALMMTIFFTRYAVAVLLAFNPSLRQADSFTGSVALVYGFLSGMFLARALRAWRAARAQR